MNITIYGLVDPEDGAIRYVGQTRGSLRTRLSSHVSKPSNKRMKRWIGGLKASNLRPEIVTLETVVGDERVARKAERHWVEQVSRRHNLLNGQNTDACLHLKLNQRTR